VSKLLGAAGLGVIALFMLLGFFRSEAALHAPATLAALALTVGLPAAGASLLLRSHAAERAHIADRKDLLRRQTIDADILTLAAMHGGRLTAVEVAAALALSPEAAKQALDGMTVRGHADLEVTDAGVLVYSFYDVRHLEGKRSAKGLLDA
jgi:hypothetical protein